MWVSVSTKNSHLKAKKGFGPRNYTSEKRANMFLQILILCPIKSNNQAGLWGSHTWDHQTSGNIQYFPNTLKASVSLILEVPLIKICTHCLLYSSINSLPYIWGADGHPFNRTIQVILVIHLLISHILKKVLVGFCLKLWTFNFIKASYY